MSRGKTLAEQIGAVMKAEGIGFAAAIALVKDELRDANGVTLADGLVRKIMEEKKTDFDGVVATIENVLDLTGKHPAARVIEGTGDVK